MLTLSEIIWLLESQGYAQPGRVRRGYGYGWLQRTRERQNEPKSAWNGGEMSKICSKYEAFRISAISCPNVVHFGRSRARFARKTRGYM